MAKRKSIWIAVVVLVMGLLFMIRPVQAAEIQVLSENMRVAVKTETAQIYEDASMESAVVKTVKFGKRMDTREAWGDWYRVSGGFVRKADVVLYDRTKKHIALTFDDGPSKANTKTVLKALKKYNAKATFMVVGKNVNGSTCDLLKQELELGCEIGNHSYSHVNFKKSSLKKVKSELKKTDDRVKKYTGTTPTVIRAPYGAFSKTTLRAFDRANIFWSMDTLDWKYRNTNRLIKYVSKNARDGKIVLMHDIHKSTAKAVDSILKNLTKRGYEMVTVTELSAIKGVNLKAGKTYSSFKEKK